MKIIKVIGGLGNQMFQYAFYLSIKQHFPTENVLIDNSLFASYSLHNGFELPNVFNVVPEYADTKNIKKLSRYSSNYYISRILRHILPQKKTEYIESVYFLFDPKVFYKKFDAYYDGYWQNENYFNQIENKVRRNFIFKKELDKRNQNLVNLIQKENSVSIHIRRGDYVNHKIFGGICDLNYYKNAIRFICEKIDQPVFYIFSNNIEWCNENLATLLKGHCYSFVNWNNSTNSYIDMQLMSNCKYNIIANSSFSWWAAWLNNYKGKIVIAPQKWAHVKYADKIQLSTWILI
jgi:hypothetical protein